MDFKFKTKPFKHQLEVFNNIKDLSEYALFWEMGLGKTKTLIDLIRYKFQKHGEGKVLVVCPKIVRHSWLKELGIHSYMQDLAIVVNGKKDKKLSCLNRKDKKIFLINYETLLVLEKELQEIDWLIIIADEGHRIKNPKSARGKIITKIAKKSKFRFLASGTPILKNYMDIYNEFKFLDLGKTFGTSFSAFKFRYFIDANSSWKNKEQYFPKWETNPAMIGEFRTKLHSKSDRKKKIECLDLPDAMFETIYVDMSPEQNKAYEEIKTDLITWINSNEAVTAQNVLTRTLRLVQITSGFVKTVDGKIIPFENNPKLQAMDELLEDLVDEHKIIISCAFIQDIEFIGKHLEKYNPAYIYGKADSEKGKEKFVNDPSCRILIAHPHSLIGINDLIISDYLIYYSNNFSYEDRFQSRDRIHRPGQKHKVTYIDIVAGPIDQLILDNLNNKEGLAGVILSSFKNNKI